MDKMILILKGRDSWDRPVYECEDRLYVDVSPVSRCDPDICTKYGNAFDGEPDCPVTKEFEFIPFRDIWY